MCARIRVSCRVVSVCWLYGVHTGRGGIASSSLSCSGGALTSVPDVFVCSLFQSEKPCKQLSLHSFTPTVCCAALSVLICRLCLAEKHAVFAEALLGNER